MWVSGETNSRSGEQQAVSGMRAARLDRVGLDTAGAAVVVAAHHPCQLGDVLRGSLLLLRLSCTWGSSISPPAVARPPSSMPAEGHHHHQLQGATA